MTVYSFVFRYIAEDGVQRSYTECVMGWYGDAMWRWSIGLENYVAASLMDLSVSPPTAKARG